MLTSRRQEEMLRVAATARCEYFESVDRRLVWGED